MEIVLRCSTCTICFDMLVSKAVDRKFLRKFVMALSGTSFIVVRMTCVWNPRSMDCSFVL